MELRLQHGKALANIPMAYGTWMPWRKLNGRHATFGSGGLQEELVSIIKFIVTGSWFNCFGMNCDVLRIESQI